MKYLVIAAHPDDDVLGVGGTIARLTSDNNEVTVLYLTDNTLRHARNRVSTVFDLGIEQKTLHDYATESANILGVKRWSCAGLQDQGLWRTPDKVTAAVELLVRQVKPDVVFTHASEDLNSDHRIAHEATLVATRAHKSHADVYAYGTHGGNHGMLPRASNRMYVRLTQEHVEKKLKALAAFELETMPYPHPRSELVTRMVLSVTGSEVNTEFAEAFDVIRTTW